MLGSQQQFHRSGNSGRLRQDLRDHAGGVLVGEAFGEAVAGEGEIAEAEAQ